MPSEYVTVGIFVYHLGQYKIQIEFSLPKIDAQICTLQLQVDNHFFSYYQSFPVHNFQQDQISY